MTIKEQLVHATKSHLQGMFDAHIANVHVYMANPAGIGEHSDIIETIDLELEKLATYHDKLEMLVKYFPKTDEEKYNDKKRTDNR